MAGTSEGKTSLDGIVSGKSWERLANAIEKTGKSVVYDDPRATSPRLKAEGVRNVVRTLASCAMMSLEHDRAYPHLVRIFDTYRQHGNANPDCVYFYSEISPEYTYRIHGKRGSARLLEIQTMDEHMLAHPNHKGLYMATDLQAEADGSIEITLSTKEHSKNWIPLSEDARWIYVRQYYYDWDNEIPADLVIERVGATYPPPPVKPEWIEERVEMMARLFPTFCRSTMNFVDSYYAAPAGDFNFVQSKSGLAGLYYGKGHFTCASDEAVIVEFKPPECVYWSFQLMNHFWESLDWDMRQTSLNGHQAQVDPDGMFRAVIATSDPGVPNWLDPAGHAGGLICGRVLRPTSDPKASMRTVPLAEVRAHVHPATPTITPAQRTEQLRKRMLGVARRFRQ